MYRYGQRCDACVAAWRPLLRCGRRSLVLHDGCYLVSSGARCSCARLSTRVQRLPARGPAPCAACTAIQAVEQKAS